jgi:NAD(P)-dependent dehydrogenase (short-subunit alcohol dehydrogenase family)
MDLKLDGKVAVVTGASKGIGLAVTWALADEGARVVAGARTTDSLDELEGAVVPDHSLAAALAAGGVVAVAVFGALMRYERLGWEHTATAPLTQT